MTHRGQEIIGQSSHVAVRPTLRGNLLVNLERGTYHQLNRPGEVVWEELQIPASERQLFERLEARIGPKPTLAADLHEFLVVLADRGLVVTLSGEKGKVLLFGDPKRGRANP